MALINCPECNKVISDKATHCINCGFPLNNLKFYSENVDNSSAKIIDTDKPKFKTSLDINKEESIDVNDDDFYIFFLASFSTEEKALARVNILKKEGFNNAGYLKTQSFISFPNSRDWSGSFLVYYSKSEKNLEHIYIELENLSKKLNYEVRAYLASNNKLGEVVFLNNGNKEIKKISFNYNHYLYKPIRNLNRIIPLFYFILSIFIWAIIGAEPSNYGNYFAGVVFSSGIAVFYKSHNKFLKDIAFRNREKSYKFMIIFLYWLVALFVNALFAFGLIT